MNLRSPIFIFVFISNDKNIFISNSTINVGRDRVLSLQLLRTDCANAP
jgi:hypothetical protein